MADPFARLRSGLPDPFAALRSSLPGSEDEDEWITRGIVQINKRTGQRRPVPKEGLLAVTPAPEKSFGETAGDLANRAITATAEGVVALPELLLMRREHGSAGKVVTPDIWGALTPDAIEGEGGFFDVKTGREDIRRQYEQRQEEFRGANLPPLATATLDTVAEVIGPAEGIGLVRSGLKGAGRRAASLLDPTQGIEGALAREMAEAAPVPRVDPFAKLREGLEPPRNRPGTAPEPPLPGARAAAEPPVPVSPAPDRRVNAGLRQEVDDALARLRETAPDGKALADLQARAEASGDRAMELATERYAFERGRGFFGPVPERQPEPLPRSLTGAGGSGGEVPIGPQIGSQRVSVGGEQPRMSTKGIENIAGMQDDLAQVVEANRPEIYAARGAPVPVSRWHDDAGLQEKLKLTPDDYLRWPKDRPFTADEHALGRAYKGKMAQEAQELGARITRGEVPEAELPVAQARKAELDRNTVRMMAALQGQGSSESARLMRSLQEALDPYGLAETPKEKLQLALLKHYGTKNADEAAKLEQRAVARLQAVAKREARKAGRAVKLEDLSAEFSALSAEFGRKASTPRMGLDPELVELIGKMATNRIKAGVVAVEELADQVYTVVRQHVEGLEREDVKAAIVEHAFAKKPKPGGPKTPTDRLAAREQRALRAVEALEAKIKAGPQVPKPGAAPLDSPRLQQLKDRAAALRAQIAGDRKHSLTTRYRALLDDETVELISRLPDPTENPEALVNFLRQMERPTFRDYAGAFAYQNMLSGPKSLVRNVGGNTIKRWDRIAMHPLSVGIESVLAPMQGRVRERYMRELLPMVMGSYRGAPEGLRKGLFVLKNGYDPERLVDDLTGVKGNAKYYEAGRLPLDPFLLSQNRAVRAFGAFNSWGIRGMQIGDVMARTRNFSSASHAWATRKALMEGKRGGDAIAARAAELLAEQPDEMIEYARRVAREDVFQDEVSNIAKLVGSARREDTGMGWALQQTVRFLNVPDRIAAWLADYTPGLRVAGAAWKGGKLRQAWGTPEASDILARQAFGTAVAAAAAAWAFDGKLVGAAPRDEKLRNDFYATGKQPWSVLVGGEWVPIRDAFGGWAAPVAAAAAFHDNAATGEPVDSEEILRRSGGAALGEMRYLLDANYMSNLSDTVEAIEAEPGQAGRELTGLAARTAAGALVPQSGLLRNVAIFRDPRVVDKEGALDEIKAAIPGLREELPSRVGPLGEELVQNTGRAGGFSPVVPTESRIADPKLAEQVERLRYTLSERRRQIRKLEQQLGNAEKLGDKKRQADLRKRLSRTTAAELDGVFEGLRADEMEIRELRASDASDDFKRAGEIRLMTSMRKTLLDELKRLGRIR